MNYQEINSRTIDTWCKEGWEWGVPISHETYVDALNGMWSVYLTPTKTVPHEWFGDLAGKNFLIESGATVYTENLSHSVRSDGQWIAFILNQFLSNSLKYRSDRPLVLTISSEDCDTHVILCFSDNGVGIRSSELRRIFDKGFVGSNGRDTDTSGGSGATGMGLYICAGLCKRLGIEIEAKSDWNQSTTFRLLFPKSCLLEEL